MRQADDPETTRARCVDCGLRLRDGLAGEGPQALYGPPGPDWRLRCPDCYEARCGARAMAYVAPDRKAALPEEIHVLPEGPPPTRPRPWLQLVFPFYFGPTAAGYPAIPLPDLATIEAVEEYLAQRA